MAIIKQVGIGRKASGTIDGITYVTRNGVTHALSPPHHACPHLRDRLSQKRRPS